MLMQILKYFKKEKKDFSLNSGERQIADKLENIREDHLARYRFVCEYLNNHNIVNNTKGLDIFCGNGYGTYMISDKFSTINMDAYDGSKEAILMANNVYKKNNNTFHYRLFPFPIKKNIYDFAISFESLEHVNNDNLMVKVIIDSLKSGGILFVSVPNENIHSLKKNPHKFHFRHYKHIDFIKYFQESMSLLEFYGQNVYKFENGICTGNLLSNDLMSLKQNEEGQVNIYVFRKN